MTLYEFAIPAFIQQLRALSAQIEKASGWASGSGTVEAFSGARLAPDMFAFPAQVRFSCLQATQAVVRLTGRQGPEVPEGVDSPEALIAHVATVIAFLEALPAADFVDKEDAPVAFDLPNGMAFDLTAAQYIRDWALPQFYFHLISAYAILRHLGVPLGKADYVPHMAAYARMPVAG